MIYGVIDIGSNTIRLSVFKVVGESVNNLFNEKDQASLRSFVEEGKVNEKGIERLIRVLKKFKSLINNFDDIDQVFPFATATIRDAANRMEILARVKEEVGFDIEILSAEEEARLAFVGASSSTDVSRGVLTDIGGGSSEIVIIDQEKVLKATSLKIGSLSAFDDFVDKLFVTKEERKLIEDEVKKQFEKRKMYKEPHDLLCAVGGSARASLMLYNEYFNIDTTNTSMEVDKLNQLVKDIINMDERKKLDLILAVKADRIHTLIPGMIILVKIAKYFSIGQINVSQTGVREGYIYDKILGKE
ncbi:MAG: exopolyphosphatase [Peptoniphilaceae bacterium]|nr:exopolyphosphatase [Peptoniphilaceae bacterium]MDY6018679.1 exopolyphosphatase [Anaerococcus sp.]